MGHETKNPTETDLVQRSEESQPIVLGGAKRNGHNLAGLMKPVA